jgi:hypothetical protein
VTHLPYIVAAYGLALVIFGGLGLNAWQRMARAKRRLAEIDPRGARNEAAGT